MLSILAKRTDLVNPFDQAPDYKWLTTRALEEMLLLLQNNEHSFSEELRTLIKSLRGVISGVTPRRLKKFNDFLGTAKEKLANLSEASPSEYAMYKQGLIYSLKAIDHMLIEEQKDDPENYEDCEEQINTYENMAALVRAELGEVNAPGGPS